MLLVLEYASAVEDRTKEAKSNGEKSPETGGWPDATGIGISHSASYLIIFFGMLDHARVVKCSIFRENYHNCGI